MAAALALALAVGRCVGSADPGTFTVVVDPGHGGRDRGAFSTSAGRAEKEASLAIARRVAARIARRGDVRVVLTRNDDRYLSLVARRSIIQSCRANLAVSIHADSGPADASGASVFVLNEAGEAIVAGRMALAARSLDADADTAYILANLQQRASINYAIPIALRIRAGIGGRDRADERPSSANFALLKAPGVPSILVECGFLTNARDSARLFGDDGQDAIARAIADPILREAKAYGRGT
ncbi:N-acetylmuramoyl-L-alanine amidase [Sphingomonas sp. A2-49]|uniref:N-acetylmuramoyl-L-alanine amidase family protein n=1 Tax=Sphingomonas sp. A2-49 TaxID=1391375 RepID=UPI0021D2526B|nr:N-acetylmuramoyl-L-alanine amidase [Sphingomonas sp. A2-49]MCU6455256.1 N-acetylmuramoyl-L-alanine amidase [Sphingomonas sp. A2-49]